MIALMKRNVRLFFRDRMTVFFSLLSSFILIGLYFLFLEGTLSSEVGEYINPDVIMFNWLIAGILAISSISTTLTVFGIKVKDDEKDITKDFYSTPTSKGELAGGYIGAAFIVSLFISLTTLVLAELLMYFQYGSVIDLLTLTKVIALILLTVFSNSAMMYFIILFLNSSSAYSVASSLIGSVSGFLAGVYIPFGLLPSWLRSILPFIPTTQAASLLRKALMASEFQKLADAPREVVLEVKETLGVVFPFGDGYLSTGQSMLYLFVSGVVFYLLAVWKLKREDKKAK